MLRPALVKEGLRMSGRAMKSHFTKPKKYLGDAAQICKQIVEECWNGKFYQVSTGNFPHFWMRDFGICVDALLELDKDKVLSSLTFALENYQRAGKVTTFITQKGKCIDFPLMAADSLPFLLHCLVQANANELVAKYKKFLEEQLHNYYKNIFDQRTGLVQKGRHFSSIRDHYIRQSACYDNCMLAMLAKDAALLGLENPFAGYKFDKLIKESFWTGTYFLEDLSGRYHVASDANIFPFWCSVFDDKDMCKTVLEEISKNGLDKPFPAKYTKERHKEQELKLPAFFAPNYEGNAIWTHLGFCLIDIAMAVDKKLAQGYINNCRKVIEKNANVLEVFNPDGTPYRRFFYVGDDGMLWAAKFLRWAGK